MSECPFIERKIKEYESELGPKLILIAEKPLDSDKTEIFDSIKGVSYLAEVFKTNFKSVETHVTYIRNQEDIPFSRCMFFNILGHYVKRNTLDPTKLAIGFIGQRAFDAFEEDWMSSSDMGGISIYLNKDKQIIKPSASWLNKLVSKEVNKNQDVLLPYVILPDIEDSTSEIKSLLTNISFTKELPDSPYNDTNQLIAKLNYLLKAYKDENIITCIKFTGKIAESGNKIEYFTIGDDYTGVDYRYCPHDVMCEKDSAELKNQMYTLLKEVLITIPVYGENAAKLAQLFSFKDQIKVLSEDEIQHFVPSVYKNFKVIGDRNGTEPSAWYHKWYKEVFEPILKPTMQERDIEREGYNTRQKFEWIYDIEVFQEDWLFVAKTLDGKNTVICWNDPDELRTWARNKILIGFNNAQYDDVMIRHMMMYPYFVKDDKLLNVKQYSDALILHGAKPAYPDTKDDAPMKPSFLSWDISFHGPFDIRRNSLKKLTMSVLNRRNYDSSVSFDIDRRLTPAERLDVEKYCEMDVDNTLALFMPDPDNPKRTFAQESYDIRWNMIVEYKMRAKTLINKSSSFAGKLLCGEDAVANKANTYRIVDGKLQYYSIPEIAYKELAGTKLLQFYIDHQQDPNYITEKFELFLGGNDEGHKYQFGFGGLHQALIGYRSKNLVNMDVASLYPSLLVQYNLMSRGASKNPKSYEEVYHTRLKAKKEGKTLLNQGLKLILNGAIGAFLSNFNPLYDTWSNSSICVHGQLMLFILAKRLYDAGFNIVQVNTDGIMIERQENVDYEPITTKWQEETRLVLEFDEIDTLAQNNVNNYYCKFTNGKVKSKGFYLSNEKFGKATSKILCNLVTDQPLLDGTEPRDFVLYKKHALGEIYDAKTDKKVDGRSLAFVVGYPNDPRTQGYYSRSKNARKIAMKDENGNPLLDEAGNPIVRESHTVSKITGFTDHMLLVDDLNTLTMDEINTSQYIAFARNLLDDQSDDFGPYFNAEYQKVEEPDVYQALNLFKDNTVENPMNNNVYAQNLLFECDDLTKEEQQEQIDRNKNLWYRVVWSGSKSYHCVVRLSRPVTVTQYKTIWQYIVYEYRLVGCDEQANIPSKYTRVPGMINPKTNEEATLYSFDKNVLNVDEILEILPRIKDKTKPFKEYTGKVDMKALERHINKLDWTEGNRFASCQKLSPRLISQVDMNTLLTMIPNGDCLDKDHKFVIRNKYRYYEKHKHEIEKELEN